MSLTNKKAVRDLALNLCKEMGRDFRRVGKDFNDWVEERLRMVIRDGVHRHPSKGKTLKRP